MSYVYPITRAVSDFFVVLNSLPEQYQVGVFDYVRQMTTNTTIQQMQEMLNRTKETVSIDQIPSLISSVSKAINNLPEILSQVSAQRPELVPVILGVYYGTQYISRNVIPKLINTSSSSVNEIPSLAGQSSGNVNTSPKISNSSPTQPANAGNNNNVVLLTQTINA